MFKALSLVLLLVAPVVSCASDADYNDPSITPGSYCSSSDPSFKEYRYEDRIPICYRAVSSRRKYEALKRYGIPASERSKYTIDHCIALVLGGSNEDDNLWPQPKNSKVAQEKYDFEFSMYQKLLAGEVDYDEVIREYRERFCLKH
jgi:hypothetical protein